jgi:hypothetical protein
MKIGVIHRIGTPLLTITTYIYVYRERQRHSAHSIDTSIASRINPFNRMRVQPRVFIILKEP